MPGSISSEKKAKLCIAIEEADESQYWLELLESLNLGEGAERKRLWKESDELLAIFVTARTNLG